MKKKSFPKHEREKAVLLGLIELYLKDGQPIGSNTLKESSFDDLSSATIRNYFAKLEEMGYLRQLHSSGGRVPTAKGLKLYARSQQQASELDAGDRLFLDAHIEQKNEDVVTTLQRSIEALAELSECAILITAPRFDQDQIQEIKLLSIDDSRLLAIIITRFGLIHTETLFINKRTPHHLLRRLEIALMAHLQQMEPPHSNEDEEALAHYIYSELMLRHIVNYATFTSSDLYKTGFSKLLGHPELQEAAALAGSLALFESPQLISQLLNPAIESNELLYYIGDEDLGSYLPHPVACSLIACPYTIQGKSVGVVALLGPIRMDYPRLFALARYFTTSLSNALTKSTHHFKITFRQPNHTLIDLHHPDDGFLGSNLLEDKGNT